MSGAGLCGRKHARPIHRRLREILPENRHCLRKHAGAEPRKFLRPAHSNPIPRIIIAQPVIAQSVAAEPAVFEPDIFESRQFPHRLKDASLDGWINQRKQSSAFLALHIIGFSLYPAGQGERFIASSEIQLPPQSPKSQSEPDSLRKVSDSAAQVSFS